MDEVDELQNMESVCRLCLSTDEPKLSVFGEQESPVSLANKIQACLSIEILATDRLSTQICAECVKNVNQWHNYKEACLRSQDKLRSWLEKHVQTGPLVVSIKSEPIDLEFYEDNIEVISESTNESDLYSLSDIIGGSCIGSAHPSNKESKSWSRASCRSWSEGTLYDPLGTSKTLWPVSKSQAMFLPEFPIRQVNLQVAYTFISVIAKGAYGKVYQIQKNDTGEYYALKVISKAKVVAENGVMQAKQEVSIQKLVGHHPFILDCSHRWQGRKTLYILTDYVSGGELFSLIVQCGSLPENVVRIYVAEIALAIDFLHNGGIVHRDIKATNVLLDDEGHAVIIDFGLAKWLNHTERTNTLCGTPEYMAPEIFNRQYYGQEVDWWSLGVLTCFMLTNQYPAGASSELLPENRGTGYAAAGTLPPNAENISPAAKDLLRRLLQPDPCLRLRSLLSLQRIAFYMGHDLQSYMAKKESPFRLLGRKVQTQERRIREFSNFDSSLCDSLSRADDR